MQSSSSISAAQAPTKLAFRLVPDETAIVNLPTPRLTPGPTMDLEHLSPSDTYSDDELAALIVHAKRRIALARTALDALEGAMRLRLTERGATAAATGHFRVSIETGLGKPTLPYPDKARKALAALGSIPDQDLDAAVCLVQVQTTEWKHDIRKLQALAKYGDKAREIVEAAIERTPGKSSLVIEEVGK